MTASPTPYAVPQVDVALWSGDNDPLFIWRFGSTGAVAGADNFLLLVQWPGGELVRHAEGGHLIADSIAGTVTWDYSGRDSAAIPQGGVARYELKRIADGRTRTVFGGTVRSKSYLLRPEATEEALASDLLTLVDTADWTVAIPIKPAPGQTINFSGTLLTITFRPENGGEVIATGTSEDGGIAFTPAAGAMPPGFAVVSRVADRSWRASQQVRVKGDIFRHPDPGSPEHIEWLGRIEFFVEPGSNSSGIATPAQTPVLSSAQPYDGRIVTAPMIVGPQGKPGTSGLPPFPPDAATVAYTLGLVAGALAWVKTGAVTPTPDPTPGVLDFSDPTDSGLLAAFLLAQPSAPVATPGVLDFTDPANSGLAAALVLAAA